MKTLLRALSRLIVLASLSAPVASHAQASDPATVTRAFIAALNAGSVDAALALLADNAIDRLTTPAPGQQAVFTGTEQIRLDVTQSVALHLAVQVETTQVAGDTVTILLQQSSDRLRAAGFPMLEATWTFTVQNGKIGAFSRGLTAESVARVNAARAAAQASPTAVPSISPAPATDPVALAVAFDAALNAHDANAGVALFADGATVHDGDPPPNQSGDYVGKAQIRTWLAAIAATQGFRIESSNYQLSGAKVTYTWKAYAAELRSAGLEPEDGSSVLVVQGARIESYSVSSSPEWRAKATAAAAAPAGMPRTGTGNPALYVWLALFAALAVGLGFRLRSFTRPRRR